MENNSCFACYAEEEKLNLKNYPFPLIHTCKEENISSVDIMKGWSNYQIYLMFEIEKLLKEETENNGI